MYWLRQPPHETVGEGYQLGDPESKMKWVRIDGIVGPNHTYFLCDWPRNIVSIYLSTPPVNKFLEFTRVSFLVLTGIGEDDGGADRL